MFQNILFGYSETLAGDTPDPGKGSKISASGDFALCEHAFGMAFPGTAWINFFINISPSYHVFPPQNMYSA